MIETKLPVFFQDVIKALQVKTNCPTEMAVQAILGIINVAVQGHYDVYAEPYGRRPTSLALIALAPTAAKKSSVIRELIGGIDKWKDEKRKQYDIAKELFDEDLSFYDREFKEYIKNQRAGTKPNKPKEPENCRYTTAKATLNGIISRLEHQSMISLLSAEGGEFFNGHSFQANDTARANEMITALTSMWDASGIDKLTGKDDLVLYNRRVSMLFLLQDEMFMPVISSRMFAKQGFTHRLLISQSQYYEEMKMMDLLTVSKTDEIAKANLVLDKFNEVVYKMINQPFRFKEGFDYELEPALIRMDDKAKMLLFQFTDETKQKYRSEDSKWYGFINGRVNEHTLRLAANIAVFNLFAVTKDAGKVEKILDRMKVAIVSEQQVMISESDMQCGIDLFNFYIAQREQLEFEKQSKTDDRQTAIDVVEWMKAKGIREMSAKELTEKSRLIRNLNKDEKSKIFAELEISGLVVREDVASTGGRTKTVFRIV